MDERLLNLYNIELRHLREMAGEFAREYPKIAGRLALDRDAKEACPDPYVERLLEGFAWLAARVDEGLQPDEIGLFVRSVSEHDRAVAAANESRIPFTVLDEHVEAVRGHLAVCTMHLAKGLEFRAVFR